MIRDRTRLSRLFGTYIGILAKRIAEQAAKKDLGAAAGRKLRAGRAVKAA